MSGLTSGELAQLRISLKDYVDVRYNSLDSKVDNNQKVSEDKIAIATDVLNSRLERMNEFRDALTDQARNFFTRPEHDLWRQKVESDFINVAKKSHDDDCRIEDLLNSKTKEINGKIDAFEKFKTMMEAKASQGSVLIAYAIGIFGLIISLVSIGLRLAGK